MAILNIIRSPVVRPLSDLTQFYNDLKNTVDQLSVNSVVADKKYLIDSIIKNNPLVTLKNNLEEIKNQYDQITSISSAINDDYIELIAEVERQLDITADILIQTPEHQSRSINIELFGHQDNRRDIPDIVLNVIQSHCDWHYPGILFYPASHFWIDYLSGVDPLYLINHDMNLFPKLVQIYPEQYQKRLRYYPDLQDLPKNQFSLITIWDFFNYISLEKIPQYLIESFELLRSGGTILFSYNNCDQVELAKLAEKNQICYASRRRILKIIKEIGFVVVRDDSYIDKNLVNIHWLELRKPGTLTTVKASQAQGVIHSR